MRRLLPALALLVCLLPAAADAQSADTTFRGFYHTLPRLTDARLKQLSEGKDLVHAGFAALELHKRTNNQAHAFRAARHFGTVLRKDSDQPWAHLGLARALVRSPRAINVVQAIGVANEGDDREQTVLIEVHTQLQLALAIDPTLDEAREMLADFAHVPSAAVPPNPIYTEGSTYFAALNSADEAGLDKLIDEIAIIATSQEMLTVTQGDFEKRRDALRLFWKKRSVRDGVSPEARVLEHYRRVHYARKQYGPPVPYYTVFGRRREGLEAELDDRGLIYVRFGPPHENNYVGEEQSERERKRNGAQVWAYRQPDGRFHVYMFMGGRMIADPLKEMSRSGSGPASLAENEKLLSVLRKYDGRYHFIAMRQSNRRLDRIMTQANPGYAAVAAAKATDAQMDDERQNERIVEKNRRMLFLAFEMDAARPRFPEALTLFHDFATFRGRRGCTDVVYSVAAPTPRYHLMLAVADTFTWDAQTIDTTVIGNVRPGEYLRATGVFCSTPDFNSYVRLTATVDSMMGVTAGGDLQIPDYSGSGLMMSDILVASAQPGSFVRGNAQLSLVPPRQFREGESFRVFYELYNLPAGRQYRTEIKLTTTESNFFARLFKGRTTTTVTFEGNAEGRDVVQELRTFVPQVEAGEAELQVTVTDLATGEKAVKKKTIWITPAEGSVKND
jgi:GWxTD domain-containing protein